MDYAYAILMFLLAGFLLLYALIVSTGQTGLIPRYYAAKVEDPKKYAVYLAKILALVALAPLGSGMVGLLGMDYTLLALLTLLVLLVVNIVVAVKHFHP